MARRTVRSLMLRTAAASRADRGHVSAAPDTPGAESRADCPFMVAPEWGIRLKSAIPPARYAGVVALSLAWLLDDLRLGRNLVADFWQKLEADVAELLVVDGRGRVEHEVDAALVLREGDHVADVGFVGQ